jgi:hypothetical protein
VRHTRIETSEAGIDRREDDARRTKLARYLGIGGVHVVDARMLVVHELLRVDSADERGTADDQQQER